jgi:hypothetical protein
MMPHDRRAGALSPRAGCRLGFALALALGMLLPAAAGASEKAHKPEAKPAEAHGGGEAEAKKPPKPKPKKADKTKNCQWDRDVELEVDGNHLAVPQATLRSLMKGGWTEQDGFELYGSVQRYALQVKDKEGNWYAAAMTRLGDENEGCLFFLVGKMTQLKEEPSLR